MRTLFVFAAVAAALTSTIGMARADDTAEQRFVHDGATYAYTITPAAKGRQVIEGRKLPNGRSFRLVVSGDRVSGVSGGVPVTFRLADAQGAADERAAD